MARLMRFLRELKISIARLVILLPWQLVGLMMRLLYGFRVEGAENLPREGPYIVLFSEFGVICTLCCGWASIKFLKDVFLHAPDKVMSYMQEELFALPYFRSAASLTESLRPLVPHSAGRLAINLLEGYRVLQNGGFVVMNPEGDMRWDGRPLPIQPGAAWLGLHTAAPVVPMICSASAYDIWPRWQVRPSLRGRVVLRVGQPFRLCDTPQERITDEDLKRANARIRAEFDQLRYGPGGVGEWVGPPLRDGAPLEQPVQLRPVPAPAIAGPILSSSNGRAAGNGHVPIWRSGMALLLWRCPVCHTNDALIHERPWVGSQTLRCRVCETRWEIRRVVGKDFRLKVVGGPPDLLGLDMALSAWYDEMKRAFQPSPIPISRVNLLSDDEKVYLEANKVALLPYRPNALFEGWVGREPPRVQLRGRSQPADWTSIGEGRLLLTSHRLLWEGPQGELDFSWSSITAVYLWLLNTLGIRYGAAPYRFSLGQENGLKWLTYAGSVVQQVAAHNGHKVTLSAF